MFLPGDSAECRVVAEETLESGRRLVRDGLVGMAVECGRSASARWCQAVLCGWLLVLAGCG
ncbi:MAG: hypothetical protein RIT02_828, partial [Planctomycetota bacterium]